MLVNVGEGPGDDASVGVPLGATSNCEGLSGACLTVGKDGAVVAFKAGVQHILRNCLKDGLLAGQHIEDAIKFELIKVVFDLGVLQAIPFEVELDSSLVGIETCTIIML